MAENELKTSLTNVRNILDNCLILTKQTLNTFANLEYLQNTSGAYFELDYKPNSNTKIITQFSTSTAYSWQTLFRSKTDNRQGTINFGRHDTSSYRYYLNNGSHLENFLSGLSTNTKYTFEFTNSYYKRDNGSQNSIRSAPVQYQSTENLFLMQSPYSQGIWKLYYFKIYDNDNLLFDLVPVKRLSDDKICLLNKVSGDVLIGTGTFIAGPEI